MPRNSTEKLSIEPILQDFSVSSLTDTNPDVLLPSDSSLIMTVAGYEVEVAKTSLSHSMSSASYPADSTIMDMVQNKSQGPLFKKPFNVNYKTKPRSSLFDLDMKDSEPDTPEQKLHKPFQRKKRGNCKRNMSAKESFVTNENVNSSNQNFNISRKNITVENSLFDEDIITSESENSFSTGPVFQRRKGNNAKKISLFNDVFEKSINNTSVTPKTFENIQVENQEHSFNTYNDFLKKGEHKITQPHDSFPGNINFVTRRKAKSKKLMKSNIFDGDILSSESDESFSLKPALKRRMPAQELKKSTIFDDALEHSITYNLSSNKSSTPKMLPFKTTKRTHAKDLSLFDSLLNESLTKSENKMSLSPQMFPKKFVNEQSVVSINFDDVVNNTCDGPIFLSNNSLTPNCKSGEEDNNLSDSKTNVSVDSSLETLNTNNQITQDISNKNEEFNISFSTKLSHSEVDETNKADSNAILPNLGDQDSCAQVHCEKDQRPESQNSITKLHVEEVSCGLENDAEAHFSPIPSTENCFKKLTSTGQDKKTVISTNHDLEPALQSNELVTKLSIEKHKSNIRAKESHLEDFTNPNLNYEPSNNQPICKHSRVSFNVNETDTTHESNDVQEEPNFKENCSGSIFKSHSFNAKKPSKIINSESRYCKYDEDSSNLSKSVEGKSKSLTSPCKTKKPNVKRVSFKLRNEGKERKTDENLAHNNTYLEEKSYSRYNQSKTSNTSCFLESLVLDGYSSEITSDSVYLDLCVSRNKSSSLNVNLEGNGYQANNLNKIIETPRQNEEVAESIGNGNRDNKMDENHLGDLDDILGSALEEYDGESLDMENPDGEELQIIRDNGEKDTGRDSKEHEVEDEILLKSIQDPLVQYDESCTISGQSQYSHHNTEKCVEDNESSLLCSENNGLRNINSLPVNIHNYQFKKPGHFTILNEKLSTPPSKRKVREMLDKMPLSELRRKKTKPVSVDLTKEQMEQDKIEEILSKRQKHGNVRATRTPNLTKPKYMHSKVYDFIIQKLTPSFGIKARVKAESVVIILNEQVDVIMKKENEVYQAVNKMKITLANLKIIHTHWDFYKFIMNYFDGFFTQKVYRSGVRSPFEPDDPFQNILSP